MKRLFFAFISLFPSALFAVDFEREIRPLLEKHCVECHGEKKQSSELRLDAKVFALKGDYDGPAIIASKVSDSPLYQRISSQDADYRMPPEGEGLTSEQIALVKAWIDAVPFGPESDVDKAAANDKRKQHWSVQPVADKTVLAAVLEPTGKPVDRRVHRSQTE